MANKLSKFESINLINEHNGKKKNNKKKLIPITQNPFLNYFLSKHSVSTESKLYNFARKIDEEWMNMYYYDKSPYYQLADEAIRINYEKNKRRKRKRINNKNNEDIKISDVNLTSKDQTIRKNSDISINIPKKKVRFDDDLKSINYDEEDYHANHKNDEADEILRNFGLDPSILDVPNTNYVDDDDDNN